MADCPKLSACPFFGDRMAGMPAIANMLKQGFCRADFAKCARYQVATAGVPVPADLFPNQVERVAKLVANR
jgi:hypothetical protein